MKTIEVKVLPDSITYKEGRVCCIVLLYRDGMPLTVPTGFIASKDHYHSLRFHPWITFAKVGEEEIIVKIGRRYFWDSSQLKKLGKVRRLPAYLSLLYYRIAG